IDAVLIGVYRTSDLVNTSSGDPSCPCPTMGFGLNQSFTSNINVTLNSIDMPEYAIVLNARNNQFSPSMAQSQYISIDPNTSCGAGGEPASCTYDILNDWPSFIAGGLVFTPNNVSTPGGIRV